nr:hypothetical protein [Candidatus Sigynarchaeum springense]
MVIGQSVGEEMYRESAVIGYIAWRNTLASISRRDGWFLTSMCHGSRPRRISHRKSRIYRINGGYLNREKYKTNHTSSTNTAT